MASVSKRIQKILNDESLTLSSRGNNERDARDIAEALTVELTVSGNDDKLVDELETGIAAL